MGGDATAAKAAIAASTRRFKPRGWLAWTVVLLALATAGVSVWAMVESIRSIRGAATQFWAVVGKAQQQVRSLTANALWCSQDSPVLQELPGLGVWGHHSARAGS